MSIRALSWSLAAAALCLSAAGGAQAQIVISKSQTDVSCNGGSNGTATAIPSGGTAPYFYEWSPAGGTGASAVDLRAGTYTVTVTDDEAVFGTAFYTITQPSTYLEVSPAAMTNVAVYGEATGSATVRVSGGTPGYSYSWVPSGGTAATASGLAAGTYTVTVTDANSCQRTYNFTITQPAAVGATTISSVSVPRDATYAPGQTLSFTVNVSEAVTVNTTGGTPRIALTVGAATRYATYQYGSGTSSLTFQYTVLSGDADSNGIIIGLLGLNGGTIRNGSTDLNLTLNSVAATSGVLVGTPLPAPIPTLTEWAMILLAGLLGLFGLSQVLQRRRIA